MIEYRTLRPGVLVSLSTSIDGGVEYQRVDLENCAITDGGSQRSRWETTRTVVDPKEHEEAVKVRGKCRALITGVCTSTARHLLCPLEKEALLREKITEARELAWAFNKTATTTSVTVSVICSRVANDDQQAAQEISLEFRALVALAESGVAQMDKKKVQDAAAKMKDLGQVFNPDSKLKVDDAVAAFRKVARKIGKAGEAAAVEIDTETMAKLRAARTAFLDLDGATDDTDTDAAQQADVDADSQANDIAADLRQRDVPAVDFSAWDDEPMPDPADTPAGAAPDGLGRQIDMDWDDYQASQDDNTTTTTTETE